MRDYKHKKAIIDAVNHVRTRPIYKASNINDISAAKFQANTIGISAARANLKALQNRPSVRKPSMPKMPWSK